ncbi:hypothetical protein Nmel_018228 [Mimus melanotis]
MRNCYSNCESQTVLWRPQPLQQAEEKDAKTGGLPHAEKPQTYFLWELSRKIPSTFWTKQLDFGKVSKLGNRPPHIIACSNSKVMTESEKNFQMTA